MGAIGRTGVEARTGPTPQGTQASLPALKGENDKAAAVLASY
jgi:hypothetical protein